MRARRRARPTPFRPLRSAAPRASVRLRRAAVHRAAAACRARSAAPQGSPHPSAARSRPRPPQRTRASLRRWRFLRRAAACSDASGRSAASTKCATSTPPAQAAAASKTSSRARSAAMRALLAPSARCSPSSAPRCPKRIATRLAAVEHAISSTSNETVNRPDSTTRTPATSSSSRPTKAYRRSFGRRSSCYGGHPRREAVQCGRSRELRLRAGRPQRTGGRRSESEAHRGPTPRREDRRTLPRSPSLNDGGITPTTSTVVSANVSVRPTALGIAAGELHPGVVAQHGHWPGSSKSAAINVRPSAACMPNTAKKSALTRTTPTRRAQVRAGENVRRLVDVVRGALESRHFAEPFHDFVASQAAARGRERWILAVDPAPGDPRRDKGARAEPRRAAR